MAFGYFPERLLHTRGTPRLLFLPLVSALMAATCAGLACARLPALFPLAAASGFAFGGHWSLFPALVSELFGLARFAANYTLAQLAPAAGSFGLALGLAGRMYEVGGGGSGHAAVPGSALRRYRKAGRPMHGVLPRGPPGTWGMAVALRVLTPTHPLCCLLRVQRALARHGGGSTTCVGQDCFRDTFLVEAALGLVATAAATALYRRHAGLYEHHARQLHTYDEEVQREGAPPAARRV
jgi:hypothetical protein